MWSASKPTDLAFHFPCTLNKFFARQSDRELGKQRKILLPLAHSPNAHSGQGRARPTPGAPSGSPTRVQGGAVNRELGGKCGSQALRCGVPTLLYTRVSAPAGKAAGSLRVPKWPGLGTAVPVLLLGYLLGARQLWKSLLVSGLQPHPPSCCFCVSWVGEGPREGEGVCNDPGGGS